MICEICQIEDCEKMRCAKCQRDLEIYLDDDADNRNYAEFLADHRDRILYILINEKGHYIATYGVFDDRESAYNVLMDFPEAGLTISTAAPRALREKKEGL